MPDVVDLTMFTRPYEFVLQAWWYGFSLAFGLHFMFWLTGSKKWMKWLNHGD